MGKNRIHILYVETCSEIGGGQLGLVDILRSIDRDIFKTSVLLPQRSGPVYELVKSVPGTDIFILKFDLLIGIFGEHPLSPAMTPFAIFRLKRLFKKISPDIIHSNQIYAGKYACVAAKKLRIPNIVTMRSVFYAKRFGLHRFVDGRLAHNADYVVFNSGRGRDLLSARIKANNILTIRNGINIERLVAGKGDRAETRQTYNLPAEKLLMATVAKLTPYKGHSVLIDAMPEIVSRFSSACFVFVGDEYSGSGMKKKLTDYASEKGVSRHITWIDFTDNATRILNACDLCVLPSELVEGLPRVIIESMALGIIPVASDIGGVSEMVKDGDNGFLCKSGDSSSLAESVCRALGMNKEDKKIMAGKNVRIAREKFELGRMAGRYQELYLSMLRLDKSIG